MKSPMNGTFDNMARLLGPKGLEVLQMSHIMVIGLGGVGSWAAESLARSGVGALTLVDLDDLCFSNITRQVHALYSTVGKLKVDVLAQRLLDINPELKITKEACFCSEKNIHTLFSKKVDYILDATDDFQNKMLMIELSYKEKIPFLTVGAAGGKRDPLKIMTGDLTEAQNDKLLARLRKKLRQEKEFPRKGGGPFGIPCVYSIERAVYPNAEGCPVYETLRHDREEEHGPKMNCNTGYGSASFVTGTFGFVASYLVIKALIEKHQQPWI